MEIKTELLKDINSKRAVLGVSPLVVASYDPNYDDSYGIEPRKVWFITDGESWICEGIVSINDLIDHLTENGIMSIADYAAGARQLNYKEKEAITDFMFTEHKNKIKSEDEKTAIEAIKALEAAKEAYIKAVGVAEEIFIAMGEGRHFQDRETGVVYQISRPKFKKVRIPELEYNRTRNKASEEKKGGLSLTGARALGYEVE